MAQVPYPAAVQTGQVLVGQEGVPLASKRLHPGELGGHGDVLELRFQAQVEGRRGDLAQ